jgi:hypothetical protein
MEKNTKVNVLIHNLEWKFPTTQAIGWHPIIEAIPSNSNPKMGQKDEIVWLDSPNHRFSIKVAWEQLRIHYQMVEWHDIVWFKNVVPRHSFLLWMAVQQKLTTQDRLHRFGIYMVPIDAHSVFATMRITTTYSLNAPILKRYGGMFVTDTTFQE